MTYIIVWVLVLGAGSGYPTDNKATCEKMRKALYEQHGDPAMCVKIRLPSKRFKEIS